MLIIVYFFSAARLMAIIIVPVFLPKCLWQTREDVPMQSITMKYLCWGMVIARKFRQVFSFVARYYLHWNLSFPVVTKWITYFYKSVAGLNNRRFGWCCSSLSRKMYHVKIRLCFPNIRSALLGVSENLVAFCRYLKSILKAVLVHTKKWWF